MKGASNHKKQVLKVLSNNVKVYSMMVTHAKNNKKPDLEAEAKGKLKYFKRMYGNTKRSMK